MENFRAMLGRLSGKKERPKPKEMEPSGFEKYKGWCEQLLSDFEQNFDPKDKTKTQDIYRQAKRLSEIIIGAVNDIAYGSAIFGDSSSALGGIGRKDLSARNQNAQALGGQVRVLLIEIDRSMNAMAGVVNKQTLENECGQILPIKANLQEGVHINDFSFTHNYLAQLRANNRKASDYASVKDVQAIIRKEDLQAVSGVYRSINLDRNFWHAIYEDIMSTDPQVYNGGFLNNLQYIKFNCLGKICDTYERAYSKDGLSASDKGIAAILGIRGSEDLEASLDEDKIPDLNIPDSFIEQKSFFQILGINPKDLMGKTEGEIKKLLRTNYYDLAKRCHPDITANKEKEEEFKKLDEAYKILVDPVKRINYIKYGN